MPEEVRALAERVSASDVLIKVCAAAGQVRAVLPPGWTLGQPRFFMTSRLQEITALPPVDGFTLSIRQEEWGWLARATDEGEVVGRLGLLMEEDTAMLDRLIVDESHRGRGLGIALAAAMQQKAISQGATSGALVATAAGRPLYERLGWQVVSDYTTAIRPN